MPNVTLFEIEQDWNEVNDGLAAGTCENHSISTLQRNAYSYVGFLLQRVYQLEHPTAPASDSCAGIMHDFKRLGA